MAKTKVTGKVFIDAVIAAIKTIDTAATIYDEKQQQGAVTPYYHVSEIRQEQTAQISGLVSRGSSIKIRYEPPQNAKNKYERCAETGNNLLFKMRKIPFGDVFVNGTNISYEIIDEVLLFYVTYHIRAIEEQEINLMQNLEINEGVNE